METPVLNPVVPEKTEKTKKPMSQSQLDALAKAREKAMEVRKAKAAARKAEAENPPDLTPVFHGEDPPEPPPPVKPTAPEVSDPSSESEDEEQRIEAEIKRRMRERKDKKKQKKEAKKVRYVVEESESESEDEEVILVRKKPRSEPTRHAYAPPPTLRPNPFHGIFPRPGGRRY